jgi:hypothetical protein
MPSYLDFDSTAQFRDSILARTLQQPNGPQTFTNSSYAVETLNDFANTDPGEVDTNLTTLLQTPSTRNTFTVDAYDEVNQLRDIPRLTNDGLYPYFTNSDYSLVGIMATENYDNESRLMQFAARNIRENSQGPVLARITQNLVAATYGRVRLIDALEGNLATATNIVTGREDLIEKNYKITVAKTLAGKAIDFIQTVAGVEFPWSEIPGDYLTDPRNPINNRPEPQTGLGAIIQDVTGVLGSLIGIQRRPKLSRKPSDLMIEYMGSGQKDVLFDNLRYSTYAPNYTKTARSQQSSKLFNFVNQVGDAINDVLGTGAPRGLAYIGDDRGEDVKYAMGDFNDNIVRSSYYLSLMFDQVQTELFRRQVGIPEGGPIGGNLTWYSSNSQNKLGENNDEYNLERSQLEQSLSNTYSFRSDSILGKTQELLNTMPSDGGAARSHVANAIDQTSRIFREGDKMISRGSAIQYVDKFGGESGVEYCRVWTKDNPYMNMSDTMKRTGNVRKFDDSVMTTPWNLNYGPMSNGQGSFEGSSNIVKGGDGYYAKKYMFSIENLAWKTSNLPGFTYSDLPFCERGNNGGRVMWFPPYDLKVSEQNNARWESNNFLGRPEPIYTYQNTERSGQIQFKVIVDHPSILNLMVSKVFKDMSDEEADNYINAFFAGCEEIDFYSLIRTYTTLTNEDINNIKKYLEAGTDPEVIKKIKVEQGEAEDIEPIEQEPIEQTAEEFKVTLFFPNDIPKMGSNQVSAKDDYSTVKSMYDTMYGGGTGDYMQKLENGLILLSNSNITSAVKNDKRVIFGNEDQVIDSTKIDLIKNKITSAFTKLNSNYSAYEDQITSIKTRIENKEIKEVKLTAITSTSSIAGDDYNIKLSLRRSHSILKDVVKRISKNNKEIEWTSTVPTSGSEEIDINREYTFKELGFEDVEGKLIIESTSEGETTSVDASEFGGGDTNVDCHNDEIQSNTNLKKTAPVTFYCRQGTIDFTVKPVDKVPEPIDPDQQPPFVIKDEEVTVPGIQKPPINEMKKIIMKTLSECYYFKMLEEDSPVTFKSLKEKLKYFHPAFHSMTPEGLNARLNFLLQCVRPGDTIPIKGLQSENDLRARNTSFGPPPICVVRIGDFYHSKVVIRDVNINYDESTWDLNPEGIGVQPMLANVTLQVNFIGGQGLSKPVERLQNALSSNFFANTEMYDPRSVSTSNIDGKTTEEFTKEFLESLQGVGSTTGDAPLPTDIEPADNQIQGKFIGEQSDTEISYGQLVSTLFTDTESYYNKFVQSYDNVLVEYGPQVHSLVFSPNYRTVNTYTVMTSNTGTRTINLFGEYDKVKSLDNYVTQLKVKMVSAIETLDVSTMLSFHKFLSQDKIVKSNDILRPKLRKMVEDKLDSILSNNSLTSLSESRNKVIKTLDSLNYMTQYYSDGKLNSGNGTQADLSGFTYSSLYDEYDHCIDYFDKNSDRFISKLDNTINFNSLNVDITVLSELLSVLLYKDDKYKEIIDIYKEDSILYPQNILNKIERKVDRFFDKTKEEKVRTSRFKGRKNEDSLTFTIQSEQDITNPTQMADLERVHSKKIGLGSTLNYYRP